MTSIENDFEVDDFIKEDCGCGHRRYAHAQLDGRCGRAVRVRDFDSLPAPVEYVATDNLPFGWPSNWPSLDLIPEVEKPCPCAGFHSYNPEPAFEDELAWSR